METIQCCRRGQHLSRPVESDKPKGRFTGTWRSLAFYFSAGSHYSYSEPKESGQIRLSEIINKLQEVEVHFIVLASDAGAHWITILMNRVDSSESEEDLTQSKSIKATLG